MYSKIYESEKIKTTYILKRKECVLTVSLYLSVVTLTAGYAFTPLVYPLVLVPSLCLSGETEKYSSHFFLDLSDFVTTLAEFGLPTPTRGRAEQTAEHREISTATLSLPCASFYFEEIEVLP